MFRMFNKDVELVFVCLKEDLKVNNVGKNLGDLLVNDRDLLFDYIVGYSIRMHAAH